MMKTNHNVSSASLKKSRVSPIQDPGMAGVLLSEEAQDTSSSQPHTVNPVKVRNPSNLPTPAGFSKHRRPLCLDRVMSPIDTGHCSSVNCSLGHRVEMSPVVLVQKLPESESTSGNVLSKTGSFDETEQAVESLMVEHQVSPASIPAHGQQPTACPSPNTLIQTTHKTTRQRSKTTRRSSNTPALSANRGTDQPTKRKRSNPGKDASCSQDCVRRRTKNSKPELRCPLLPVATATVNNSEQPVKKKRGRPPKVQLQASQCDTSHKSPHYMVTQMDMRQGGVKVLVKEVPVSKRKNTSCYKCKTCGFRTKDKAAKMEHIQACHSHRCPYCQRGFSSQEVLSSHKTVCAVESSLQCSVCQRSFHRTHRKQHFHGHIHSLIVQGVRSAVREIQQCGSLDKFLSSITCDPASECQKCHPAWLTLEQDHGKQPVEELPPYAGCFPDYSDIPVTHTSHHFVPVAVGSDGAGTEDTSAVGNHHLSSCSYYDQGTGFSYEQSIPSDTHCTTDTELQGTIVYDFDNDMYIFSYKDDACTARDVEDSAGVSDSQTAGSVSDQSLSCKPASHEDRLYQARGGSEMTGAQGSDSYEGSIIHACQTEAPGSKIMLADLPSQPCQTLDFPDHQGGETSNGGSTFTDLLELLDEFDLTSMDVGEETLVGLDALCEDSGAGDKLMKTLPLPSLQNTQMDHVANNPSSVCYNPEAGFVSGAGTPDKHVHNDQLMSSWGPPEDCVGRQQGCCSGSGPATQASRAAQHGQTSQRHPAPCTQSEHVVRDSSLSVGNCFAFLGATEVEVMPGGLALSNMGGNTGRGLSVDLLLPSLDHESGQPLYSSLTHLDDSSYTNGSDDSGIEVHAGVSAVSGNSDYTSSATEQELVCIGESRMGSCCTDTRLTELNSSRQAESGQTEVEMPNSDSNTVPCSDKAPNPSGTSTSQNVSQVNTSTVRALSPYSEHVSTFSPQGGDRKTSTSQNVCLVTTSTVFALSPCSEHVSTFAPQGGDRQTSTSQNVGPVNRLADCTISHSSKQVSTDASQGSDRGPGHPLDFEIGSVATIKNVIAAQVEKTKPGQQLNRDLAGTSSSPHLDVLCISSEDVESLAEPELSEEDIDRSSLTHNKGVGLKAHPSSQALFNVTSSCQSAASDSQMGTDRNILNSDTPGFSCPNTNLVRLTSDHSEFTGTVTADCATVMILHANSLQAVWASGQCLLPSETEGTAHLESCAQDKGAEEPLDSSNTGEGRLPSPESLQTFSAFVSTEKCISGTLQFLKETVLSTGTNTACRKIEVSEQAAHFAPETYQGMLKMPETEKIIGHRSVDVEAADSVVCPSAESVSDSKSKPAAQSSYPRLTGHTVGRLVGICPESCSSAPDEQVSTPVARPDVMTSSTTDCEQPFSPAITSSPKVKQLTLTTTQASTAAVVTPLNAQVQQNMSADSPESAGLEHTIEQPSSLVVQNSAMSPQSLDKFGVNTRVVETSIEPERTPAVASVSNTCSISAPTFSPHVYGSAPETPVLHEIEMNSSGGRKDDSTDFEVKLAVCNMNSGKRTVSDFQGNVQMVLTAPAVHSCCVSAVSGDDSAVVKPNLDDLDVSTPVTEEKSLPLLQIFADIPSSEQTPRVTADTEVISATNPVVDGVSVKLLTTEHAYAAALDTEWSSVNTVTY